MEQRLLSGKEIGVINAIFNQQSSSSNFAEDLSHFASSKNLEILHEGLFDAVGSDLATRAVKDPSVARVGIIALFDGVYQKLSQANPATVKAWCISDDAFRGAVYGIKFGQKPEDAFVIKGYQGRQEHEVIQLASQHKFGPQIYGPRWIIVEDYLIRPKLDGFHPKNIGLIYGDVLKRMYAQDVIYGDGFVPHLRFDPKDGLYKLIDFGTSFQHNKSTHLDKFNRNSIIDFIAENPVEYDRLDDPEIIEMAANVSTQVLKERELYFLGQELSYEVKFPIQYGGFRFFTKSGYMKELKDGLCEGSQIRLVHPTA